MKNLFKIIYVEDPKIGGYTAFFKNFPNIITEGNTRKKARKNLWNALYDILKDKLK